MVQKAVAAGRDEMDAWSEYGYKSYGDLVKIPGLPPMYDCKLPFNLPYSHANPSVEFRPQLGALTFPPQSVAVFGASILVVWHDDVKGFVLPYTAEFEPEATAAMADHFGKPCHMAGIQFPISMWEGAEAPEFVGSEGDRKIMAFLDEEYKKHGKDSVIYISQGSLWFPFLRPEVILWLLESLYDHKIPFMYAHGGEMAALSQEVIEKFNKLEGCMVSKFAPQWQVLEHPAIGFFAVSRVST
jgi:hypothetical protein